MKPYCQEKVGICLICGESVEEGFGLCESHVEDAVTLMTAIMKAKSADDVVAAWLTWQNGEGRKKTTFLDNCHNCGKLMWIEPWERRGGRHGGKYCSRECRTQASKEKTTLEAEPEQIQPKGDNGKNPDAVALGRRSAIASNAVRTRWGEKDKPLDLTTNSRCPKCGTRTLERDGTDLHCWGCGHIIYYVFAM